LKGRYHHGKRERQSTAPDCSTRDTIMYMLGLFIGTHRTSHCRDKPRGTDKS
jgi:hypothetical protein